MSLRNARLRKRGGQVLSELFVGGSIRPVFTLTTNTTLTKAYSGALLLIGAANLVISLPATEKGLEFIFILQAAGLSAGTGLSVSPVALDKIMGNGFTAADNKDAILAGASDRDGDSATFSADGADGYYIRAVTGTWTREA